MLISHVVRQRGFTLVESIIALLVLSVSVGSLFMVYALATPYSAKLIEAQRASLIADAYYQDIRGLKYQDLIGDCVVDGAETHESRATYDDVDDLNGVIDRPPFVFGQPFKGFNAVYENYSVSINVHCDSGFVVAGMPSGKRLKRIALTVTSPSGQGYQFAVYKGQD